MAAATNAADALPAGRRRADAQRSIEAITRAALTELARTGDVNMSEIARSAGVGRVTLYGHFPSKEALVDAVVSHAITTAKQALTTVDLADGTVTERLRELAISSWQILNEHRQLMVVGHRHLGAARMRTLHDSALDMVERLVARGQKAGELRTDAPRSWLVATYYALLHAAAEEVNAGRLRASAAGPMLADTITAALRSPEHRSR
jgi:TetR/AcrR family transcriptional repressor of mexCD-oprJ operon